VALIGVLLISLQKVQLCGFLVFTLKQKNGRRKWKEDENTLPPWIQNQWQFYQKTNQQMGSFYFLSISFGNYYYILVTSNNIFVFSNVQL
jgi:hypothetical protein